MSIRRPLLLQIMSTHFLKEEGIMLHNNCSVELSKMATFDKCINKTDIQNRFNAVAKDMEEKKVLYVFEKKEPKMVILDPEEFLSLMSTRELSENLMDALEVANARLKEYQGEEVVNKLFKKAGLSGL